MVKQTARAEKVIALTQAGFQGMEAESMLATPAEVVSACLTIALRGVDAALQMGANPEPLREAIAKIYELLPPIEKSQTN